MRPSYWNGKIIYGVLILYNATDQSKGANRAMPMLDYPVISFGASIDKQSLKFLCRLPDDTKSIL